MPEQQDGKQQISIRLTAEALAMVDEQSRLKGVGRTAIIEMAIREAVPIWRQQQTPRQS